MFKRKIGFALALTILLQLFATNVAFAKETQINLFTNKKEIVFDVQSFIENGHVYVPLRPVVEGALYTIGWEKPGIVNISSTYDMPTLNLRVHIGKLYAEIDTMGFIDMEGIDYKKVKLEAPAKLINNRTFVPLQFIRDCLDFDTEWDELTQTVKIMSPIGYPLLEGKTAKSPFSMLEDRFIIKVPEVFKESFSTWKVPHKADETVSLSEHDQIMSIYTRELRCLSTGDLANDAKIYMRENNWNESDFSISEKISIPGIEYVMITPQNADEIIANLSPFYQGKGVINSAIYKFSDNSLVFLGIHSNELALIYRNDCVQMSNSIIASIQNGSRLLDVETQKVKISGRYGIEVEVDKSDDYIVNVAPRDESCVFSKLTPIGQDNPFFWVKLQKYDVLPHSWRKAPVYETKQEILLGQPITWHIYTNKAGVIDSDTVIETSVPAEGFFFEISADPNTQSEWDEIYKMIQSITINKISTSQ